MIPTTHKCFVHRVDPRDWVAGDGHIALKGTPIMPGGDWEHNLLYNELQKLLGWDCEGCIIFAAQKSFDAQIEALIPTLPTVTIELINQWGFMDTANSLDGKAHFHSSPRAAQWATGNGYNGNALQDPWIAFGKGYIIPWTLWPFDSTTTPEDYLNPPPQNLLDIGQKFLAALGGPGAIPYHWINNGGPTDTAAMDAARVYAPLCLAILAEAPGWNNVAPPIIQGPPCHGVLNYNNGVIDGIAGELISDQYMPFDKVFVPGWVINYVLQGIVSPIPLPQPPTLPPNPTVPQESNWLTALGQWLQNILNRLAGQKTQII
jgi:hypothetical protein